MKIRVFVDGSEGTTGLRIRGRLREQKNVELLTIGPELRKSPEERRKFLNSADLVFLCLPDAASREAVEMITNPDTRVIDSSTAFRVNPGWVYGFPELSRAQREKIASAKRVAVPGCHATGFISLVYPLVKGGIAAPDYPFSCQSVSGYSGGGKKLIAQYEGPRAEGDHLESTRYYGLTLSHKHLPEMKQVCGLDEPPLFTPSVGDYDSGMLVSVPLHRRLLRKKFGAEELHRYFSEFYRGSAFVSVEPLGGGDCLNGGYLNAMACNGTNSLQIFIFANEEQILLVSRFDNLGKGASGAAVQCMNIMFGQPEDAGLALAF